MWYDGEEIPGVDYTMTFDSNAFSQAAKNAAAELQRFADVYRNKRGTPMNRRSVIKAEIERLQAELHQLEILPEQDPFPNGAVLRFNKAFIPGGTLYQFVALRSAGNWYLSGRQRGDSAAKSWQQLRDFLSEGVNLSNVQRSSSWQQAFPASEPF